MRKEECATASITYLTNTLRHAVFLATNAIVMAVSPRSLEVAVLVRATESIATDQYTSTVARALVVLVFLRNWGAGLDVDGRDTACSSGAVLVAVGVGTFVNRLRQDPAIELHEAVDGVDLDRITGIAAGVRRVFGIDKNGMWSLREEFIVPEVRSDCSLRSVRDWSVGERNGECRQPSEGDSQQLHCSK